ncbi:merozoite surface protein 7 (MSP7), putative [Plasmodium ovale wallikeri]|uniref:Merozoite surface protein 7 (MSP7), putative n=1 Tax=Plasmodium ovale wallikeri TaxID=864142 RepID=A0A1A8ZA42_PLAOA|nr:merozoite surface protein 7 (MSP7), putative [Plasmodium ovale wallikeri]
MQMRAASKRKITTVGQGDDYNQDVVNMLSQKLGNVYNAGPNNANEAVDKKYELLKKEMEELQKYEKENAEENFEQNFMTETDETSGKKKTIFGVDEDDLDSYDEEFFGQGKKIIKGEASGDDAPSGDSLEGEGQKEVPSSPPRGDLAGTGLTQDRQPEIEQPKGERVETGPGVNISSTSGRSDGGPEIAPKESLQQPSAADLEVAQRDGVTNPSDGKQGTVAADPASSPSPPPPPLTPQDPSKTSDPTGSESQRKAQETSEAQRESLESSTGNLEPGVPSAVAKDTKQTPGQVKEATAPVVKYMDSLYDEIITESGQNEKAENTKKHSNYSNLKKKYNFPMNGKEYNMVKKLFGECFKKGDTTNASENATCQVDVLAKRRRESLSHIGETRLCTEGSVRLAVYTQEGLPTLRARFDLSRDAAVLASDGLPTFFPYHHVQKLFTPIL